MVTSSKSLNVILWESVSFPKSDGGHLPKPFGGRYRGDGGVETGHISLYSYKLINYNEGKAFPNKRLSKEILNS